MGAIPLQVRSVDFSLRACRTRLPFRFGNATLTRADQLLARVEVETTDGRRGRGLAADLLVPRWFDKDPAKPMEQHASELQESARRAGEALLAAGAASLFELWWAAYRARVASVPEDAPDRLVRGFGVALVERAAMDALCRAAGLSFFQALKEDLFGFEPGLVHPALAGWSLPESLPDAPLESVEVRHTVGLADPLQEDAEQDDGFPRSLEAAVRSYGLACFKVKLSGDRVRDRERLLAIALVLQDGVRGDARVTVDANEQYSQLSELARLFDELEREPAGRRLLEGLLYVEQPLARECSFERAALADLTRVTERAPLLLDEADTGIEAFPRALERGYRGVSVKNCKGVFRALLNRGLCERAGGFQSAEDLTTLPVVALQEDLATVAALGLSHVERNGHHYFRGLDHLSADEAREALARHPDLYRPIGPGAALAIEGGRLRLGSLQCVGFGYDVPLRHQGARDRVADEGGEQ